MVADTDCLYRLEALGYLPLARRLFVAAFLKELHQLIPSLSNSYCWCEHGGISDFYDELSSYHLEKSLNRFNHQLKQLPALATLSAFTTDDPPPPLRSLAHVYRHSFFPQGYHHSLILPMPATASVMLLNRPHDQPAFNTRELSQLKQIQVLFEQGLQNQPEQCHNTTTGWQSGLLIVDQYGELLQCCPNGINLLALALQKHPGQFTRQRLMDTRAIDGIYEFVDHLLSSTSSDQQVLRLNSLWGSFEISGYPVIDTLGHRAPQVYLHICWQVPFALKLFHQIPNLRLTQRQEVIALLYATGEPTKTIASILGLSLYTIKEHVHNIFDRLGIHSRAELIKRTICETAEPEHHVSNQRQLYWTERPSVNLSRP